MFEMWWDPLPQMRSQYRCPFVRIERSEKCSANELSTVTTVYVDTCVRKPNIKWLNQIIGLFVIRLCRQIKLSPSVLGKKNLHGKPILHASCHLQCSYNKDSYGFIRGMCSALRVRFPRNETRPDLQVQTFLESSFPAVFGSSVCALSFPSFSPPRF